MLLFRVGIETDLENARRLARRATVLAFVGMLFPLLLGALGASALGVPPAAVTFHRRHPHRHEHRRHRGGARRARCRREPRWPSGRRCGYAEQAGLL
ncbi:MAG: hypothetical protein JRH19_19765 [Deltaproteobacteria bacterium]|nr:hypothetical protein [Deltaproteobacteria bacterium]